MVSLDFARRRSHVGLTLLLALVCGPAASSLAAEGKPEKAPRTVVPDDLFTSTQIVRIQIEIPPAGIETLRQSPRGAFGGPQERPTVKAIVREGGKVYKDVAIHLKGAAGSFREIDDDPALTLNFDKHVKGQTFHGIERLSLNNSVQDRSLLNEQICREMFAAAGVPVPRATHATIELNGRDLGLYVVTEAFNKQFLARHFKDPGGNLYDGGFLKDISDDLKKSSGKNPNDRSDLLRLADAVNEGNLTNRFARISQFLDVDRFITYLALDIMMCDWDGYGINRNNYRIYHDPTSNKLVFMPHGLDQMFGVMRVRTDMPLFPRMNGMVARGIMQTPQGRKLYRERIIQLKDQVFNVTALTNRVWERDGQLRSALKNSGADAVRWHEREVADFCQRIQERAKSIQEQLTAPDKNLRFNTNGIAFLTEWRSRADHGKPAMDEVTEGGHTLLHISAPSGSCVGVWSTRVRLEPGKYQLIGRVRSRGVVTDPGDRKGGAGLRNTGRRFNQKLTGDNDWKEMVFEFEMGEGPTDFGFLAPIQEETPDVELLCELRAAKGEVWFDKDALRLVRK